jgi:hypothetical protein
VLPNHDFPPDADALALADLILGSLDELTPAALEKRARRRSRIDYDGA